MAEQPQRRASDKPAEPTRDPAVDRMFARDVAAKDFYRRVTANPARFGLGRKP